MHYCSNHARMIRHHYDHLEGNACAVTLFRFPALQRGDRLSLLRAKPLCRDTTNLRVMELGAKSPDVPSNRGARGGGLLRY